MNLVALPLAVKCQRMDWKLYSVQFESPDGMFQTYLYAISDDHAALQVESLRESAVVSGQIVEVVD